MERLWRCILLAAFVTASAVPSFCSERREQVAPNLQRAEGKNDATGASWLRLTLTGSHSEGTKSSSTLTVQCVSKGGSKHTDLYVKFGGIEHIKYRPVERILTYPLPPPPPNPSVDLVVSFNGVRPMTLNFEEFPNGQLKYRLPGAGNQNTEDVSYLLHWMLAAQMVDFSFFKAGAGNVTAEFATASLMEQMRTAAACER